MRSKSRRMKIPQSETRQIIGKGVYSISEASRLTGVPTGPIARWTRGYDFLHHGTKRHSSPIIATEIQSIGGQPVLTFQDMLEVRFLNAFRQHGVGWRAIRIASQRARELMQYSHPFSTRKFKTDGLTILADFVDETGDQHLLDLVRNQYAISKIISPFLYGGIEYNDFEEPARWFPLKNKRTVVVDPTRNFGAPIVTDFGIPTRILMQSYQSIHSTKSVADWYEIDEGPVRDAIRFEKSLVA